VVYQRFVRRALFRMGGGDAEVAHERTLRMAARLGAVPPVVAGLRRYFGGSAPRTVFGVRFPGPVGLAAGMDKDGRALRAWPAFGFGFVEVGTVTWHAQPGNPRPRLYRLPASEAVINRMGFNNGGASALAERLRALGPLKVPLGVSIGKSKVTPVEEAVDDYRSSLRVLAPYADYFAVNVSSPNTPGLRGLQDKAALDTLLGALETSVPLLVKIAPDLTDQAIADVLEVCAARGVAGVIATNTTLSRTGLAEVDAARGEEAGGLSGRPLTARALEVVTFVAKESGLPVIGVGGIHSADDALRMLDAGASLVQVYTGFIYHGAGLVRAINHASVGV
jgi:dihydroorotate dehydrogenase